MLANSQKNDHLATVESCPLYYFPEIPNASNVKTQADCPARFSSGPFKGNEEPPPQELEEPNSEATQIDAEQIQCLIEESFNKGMEQGRTEIEAVQKEKINAAVAAFEASIKEMHRIRQHDIEDMEAEIVRLALAISKKIIGYESEHGTMVQHVVHQAMQKVNDTRHCIIKLNPADVETVQDFHQDLIPADDLGTTIRIEADEGIQRGGCFIETKLGDVDARLDKQIKIIEELLADQIRKPTAQI